MPVRSLPARVASTISLILLLANCGSDPTGPGGGKPGVHIVAGADVTDTVDVQPLQALVVEVRGANGSVAQGVVVRFESQLTAGTPQFYPRPAVNLCSLAALNCFAQVAIDTTDARGRAKVRVQMGVIAGPYYVRAIVPELGAADSAKYTIKPGAPAGVRAAGAIDTALSIGATATLGGRVVDRYSNPRAETPTLSLGAGSAITLNAATGLVTGLDMGNQWVFARYNSFVDSARVRVVPPGRLLVWSSGEQTVRLVNTDGTAERTIVSGVSSDYGAFPQFSPTREQLTLHAGTAFYGGGTPNDLIVVDTTGNPRRDIRSDIGFDVIMSTRELADGTVLVVGASHGDFSHPGLSLWRVATDNTITFVVAVPGFGSTYGGADISHDGTRIVYVASSSYPSELRVLDVASGSTTLLDTNANSPRWSAQDDRIVYLGAPSLNNAYDGVPTIINADGSGRRVFGSVDLSPGIGWSPDEAYVIGRNADGSGLRVIRVSDGVSATLLFPTATGCCHDYWQPDWR